MTEYVPPRPPKRIVFVAWILAWIVNALLWWGLFELLSWLWTFPAWDLVLKLVGGSLALAGSWIIIWALVQMERDDAAQRRRRRARRTA